MGRYKNKKTIAAPLPPSIEGNVEKTPKAAPEQPPRDSPKQNHPKIHTPIPLEIENTVKETENCLVLGGRFETPEVVTIFAGNKDGNVQENVKLDLNFNPDECVKIELCIQAKKK